MSKYYYAVEFKSGRNTTTGEPNTTTGRMCKAVYAVAFRSAEERDHWVSEGKITADMKGRCCRENASKKELRNLHQGMSMTEFDEMIEMIQSIVAGWINDAHADSEE